MEKKIKPINCNSDNKGKAALKISALLQRFREVETLPEREKIKTPCSVIA
jgi:hypothetical protein